MPTQVGRGIPRLEARAKVTGRAEYVHNLRLPGMLHGKIFRSTVPHGRIRRIDTGAARALAGVHRVVTIDDVLRLIPHPYYGPAFHDQPILAHQKVRHVGEPVAVVLAADPHVAEQAVQLIDAEYEELPAVYDEVEAMTSGAIVHDVLKPAGTFPDLKHLAGRRDTNVALDFQLVRGDVDKAFADGGSRVRAHLPHPAGAAPAARAVRHRRRAGRRRARHPHRLADAVVRAHRDRAPARLAGEPGARAGAASRRRVRRQGLHQARGAGRGARAAGAPAGEDFARHGRAVHHDHQASDHVPHPQRRDAGWQAHRAPVRGVLERRRLRRHRPAGDAEIRLHRAGAVRHRQREDRFLRALHQPHAGRRAARLRHPAAGVGLREPHRPDRPRARHRPGRVPPPQHPARRTARRRPAPR